MFSGHAGVERNNVWFQRRRNQIKSIQTSEVETKNKYSLKVLNKLEIFYYIYFTTKVYNKFDHKIGIGINLLCMNSLI